MMQAFVIVFQRREAFSRSGRVFGVGVDDVAGEELLPEGEAAGGSCWGKPEG